VTLRQDTAAHAAAAEAAESDQRRVRSGTPRAEARSLIMGRIGLPELAIVLFIIILIFGASRLPEIGRGIGRGIRNFKESAREGRKDD
jgi:sec-independent protein translocase protein TatA